VTPLEPLSVQQEGAQVLPGGPEKIVPPSGLEVTLQDVVWNAPGPMGLTLRFRFIAPGLAASEGEIDYDALAQDMLWLCQNFALPRVPQPGPQPAQIIISLSDVAVPFGEPSPEATQLFEAYSVQDGQCVWDFF
jgi:hypothetical protein